MKKTQPTATINTIVADFKKKMGVVKGKRTKTVNAFREQIEKEKLVKAKEVVNKSA